MATRKDQKGRLRAERLAREAEEKAGQRRRRLIQYGSGAGFIAICIVAVAIIVSQSGGGSSGASSAALSGQQVAQIRSKLADVSLVKKQLKGIPQNGNVLGDPKASVTIVEFGDLQCPVCKAFSIETAPTLISSLVRKGSADYEFRPWDIIGPQSPDASKAALAAGEQGRFWNFVELFYRNQGEENSGYVTDSFLEAIAKGAGVPDIAKWNQDRQNSKWDAVLAHDGSEATGLGFRGTPSLLVTGPGGQKTFTATVPTAAQVAAAVKAVG